MNLTPIPELATLPDGCWAALEKGADAADHPFHTAVIATVRDQEPEARIVVLRAADTVTRTLWFHTDRRSAKVASLSANARLSWVFWDAGENIQLRCTGTSCLDTPADLVAEHWEALHAGSRSLYPDVDQFLPIRCTVDRFDWLRLDRAGHRRAKLHFEGDRWQGRWVEP